MAAPFFGFSLGDFIAGLKLVKDLVEALNDSVGAKPSYQRLIAELVNLERALTEVRSLQVDDSQASQKIALEQAASQCQENIANFLEKNAKFSSTLGTSPTCSKWRTNLHKIQWGLCKADAMDKFRAEISGHVLTINTLIATIQLSTTKIQTKTMAECHQEAKQHRQITTEAHALAEKNHDLLNTQANLLFTVSRNIAMSITHQQASDLQSIMLEVLTTNMKIYELVLDMQKLHSSIPPQINRQQPVYFEDAHGRIAPFHIEFINSFEAFQAVMEVRFRHVPGLKKVRNNEYALQESNSKRKLDLSLPWDSVFLPGRKVVMSMVFQRPQMPMSSCPGCGTESETELNKADSEVQCFNPTCNMLYQRIVELDQPLNEPIPAQSTRIENHVRDNTSFSQRERQDNARKKEDSESEAEDEIYQFRRVHVVHKYRGISLLQRAAAALAGDSLSGSMTQPPPSNDGRSETSIVDDPLNIWSDMKRPPVEFRAAITYINKVKNRFTGGVPDTYKLFLDMLQRYQLDSTPILNIYAEIALLFGYTAPDLLKEFKQFLSESEVKAQARAVATHIGNLTVPLPEEEQPRAQRNYPPVPLDSESDGIEDPEGTPDVLYRKITLDNDGLETLFNLQVLQETVGVKYLFDL